MQRIAIALYDKKNIYSAVHRLRELLFICDDKTESAWSTLCEITLTILSSQYTALRALTNIVLQADINIIIGTTQSNRE
jgi:hypothetical protein